MKYMKRETVKAFLPLMRAFAAGEQLQFKLGAGWVDMRDDAITFDDDPSKYRIKPEPREFYVNIYPDHVGLLRATEAEARSHALPGVERVAVPLREVIDV